VSLALRRQLIAACRHMNASGLNQGTAGNLSVRWRNGVLLTPTGMDYASLEPADIVFLDRHGQPQGRRLPSSEWRLHHDILARRPEVGAVVHNHAPFATALACLRRDIPAFHYMVAVAGGDSIRCAGYATFGSQELSDLALAALADRKACLLANHGMLALGESLAAAMKLAVEVEALAAQYCRALAVGNPVLLSAPDMQRVQQQFKGYGHQPPLPRRRARARPAAISSRRRSR